jgi:hypothetical protein
LAHNGTGATDGDDSGTASQDKPQDPSDPYPDGAWGDSGIENYQYLAGSVVQMAATQVPIGDASHPPTNRMKRSSVNHLDNDKDVSVREGSGNNVDMSSVLARDVASQPPVGGPAELPTQLATSTTSDSDVPTSETAVYSTPAPAQAHARTQQGPKKSSCTPSPTSSLAPSASPSLLFNFTRAVNPDADILLDFQLGQPVLMSDGMVK